MEYNALRSIAKCPVDSSFTEKVAELTELRIKCMKVIALNFNGKNQKINFCDVSRLQFPRSQKIEGWNFAASKVGFHKHQIYLLSTGFYLNKDHEFEEGLYSSVAMKKDQA